MKASILDDVLKELKRDKRERPTWPDHAAAQAGVVCGKAGELMEACMRWKYQRSEDTVGQAQQREQIRKIATQTAAMAIRFLQNL